MAFLKYKNVNGVEKIINNLKKQKPDDYINTLNNCKKNKIRLTGKQLFLLVLQCGTRYKAPSDNCWKKSFSHVNTTKHILRQTFRSTFEGDDSFIFIVSS